jgi:hypothetical protein
MSGASPCACPPSAASACPSPRRRRLVDAIPIVRGLFKLLLAHTRVDAGIVQAAEKPLDLIAGAFRAQPLPTSLEPPECLRRRPCLTQGNMCFVCPIRSPILRAGRCGSGLHVITHLLATPQPRSATASHCWGWRYADVLRGYPGRYSSVEARDLCSIDRLWGAVPANILCRRILQ